VTAEDVLSTQTPFLREEFLTRPSRAASIATPLRKDRKSRKSDRSPRKEKKEKKEKKLQVPQSSNDGKKDVEPNETKHVTTDASAEAPKAVQTAVNTAVDVTTEDKMEKKEKKEKKHKKHKKEKKERKEGDPIDPEKKEKKEKKHKKGTEISQSRGVSFEEVPSVATIEKNYSEESIGNLSESSHESGVVEAPRIEIQQTSPNVVRTAHPQRTSSNAEEELLNQLNADPVLVKTPSSENLKPDRLRLSTDGKKVYLKEAANTDDLKKMGLISKRVRELWHVKFIGFCK
jgi:hypothetical protein